MFDLDVVVTKPERALAPVEDPYYTGVLCTILCSAVCGW
ncbi:FDLD family class I lanthipeptide [Tumebacillus amylolyticus]